jgi:probable F420-dependent oxidoreductase
VPEHTHIPSARSSSAYPATGGLQQAYYEIMDPFLALNTAATATTKLKVGTGIALVVQRDPIVTAKMVSSIDQLSAGRFLFGIGNGWNQDEVENHGTDFKSRHKLARERIEAMKAIWASDEPEYHGEFVNFDKMKQWPKPWQKPHPPIIVGGASPTRRGARCATATAGSRATTGSSATGWAFSTSSGRWPRKPAATRRIYRSVFSVCLTISSVCGSIGSWALIGLYSPCRPGGRTGSCRSSTAGVRCNESWLPETALHTVGTQYFQAFGGYYPRR